jgi:hypothetical protein
MIKQAIREAHGVTEMKSGECEIGKVEEDKSILEGLTKQYIQNNQ